MRNSIPDLLRIIAALLVAFGHGRELLQVDGGFWFVRLNGLGMCAVMIFFAVSGYSIATEQRLRKDDFGAYLLRRLTRLWVVLIPALVLTLALDSYGIHRFGIEYGPRPIWGPWYAEDWNGPTAFLLNAFFGQSLVYPSYGTNTALWSISLEFWCYMAFYFRRSIGLPIVFAVSMLYGDFWIFAAIWALGACAAYIKPHRVAWLSLPALAWALLLGQNYIPEWPLYVVIGALTACTLLIPPIEERRITYAAGMTYSLYAVHFPILCLLSWLGWKYWPALVLTLAAAFLFSRLTEAHTGRVRLFVTERLSRYRQYGRLGAGSRS